MTTVNPEMITLAREARRLTQAELAERLGITQGKLSKIEGGLLSVSESGLAKLADCLAYPADFFLQQERRFGVGVSDYFHRKRQSLGAKSLDGIHADIEVMRLATAKLLKAASIKTVRPFPCMDIDDFDGNAAEIARAVRSTWLIPRGPFRNLTVAIEEAGGLVFSCNLKTRFIDALSRLIPRLPPLFFMNTSHLTGDRFRYTLAHELGHLIMHSAPNPDMERQADVFAAELLMPAEDIRSDLQRISVPQLGHLKQIWKVSMASLLKRAADLGAITQRSARFLWMKMGKAGYRTREPTELDVPLEQPTLFRDIIQFHRNLGYDNRALAKLMLLNEDGLSELLGIATERKLLRVV